MANVLGLKSEAFELEPFSVNPPKMAATNAFKRLLDGYETSAPRHEVRAKKEKVPRKLLPISVPKKARVVVFGHRGATEIMA
jgi:hypothetical protein